MDDYSDLEPIPQLDGPHPVVSIAYSDTCMRVIWVALYFVLTIA